MFCHKKVGYAASASAAMSPASHPQPGTLLPVSSNATVRSHTVETGDQTLVITDAHTHLSICAPEGVKGQLFIRFENVASIDCEIFLDERSHCTVIFLETSAEPLSIHQRTRISADAHLHLLNVSLGASVTHDLHSAVEGINGVSSIDWLSYAKKQEKQMISVRNVFNDRNGGGEVSMRAVAEQKGTIDLQGMIDIGLHGGGTQTYLTQQVLMLDPTAKVDASPALEIKTNDVKASHSASVSRVTPEDLYYFSARGIDPAEARGLLVRGFLGELVQKLEHQEALQAVTAAIEEKYAAALV